MKKVKCEVCGESLNNWSGNVMIPRNSFEGVIDDLQIWCKECTRRLDKEGKGQHYHNLWELSWIKRDREKILDDKSIYVKRFSQRVKDKVMKIISLTLE